MINKLTFGVKIVYNLLKARVKNLHEKIINNDVVVTKGLKLKMAFGSFLIKLKKMFFFIF